MADKPLNTQTLDFCRQYIIHRNGARAARAVNYSEDTAAQQAWRLLQDPRVIKEIDRLQEEVNKSLNLNAKFITQSLMRIATSDLTDFLGRDEKGLKQMPAEDRMLITKYKNHRRTIKSETGEKVEEDDIQIVLPDPLRAIEMLARRVGYFEKDNNQGQAGYSLDDLDKLTDDEQEELMRIEGKLKS